MKAAWTALIAGVAAASFFDPTISIAKDTRFWNLTAGTITSLKLSPAGKNDWGPEQIANDPDHAVDHDERLKIIGVGTGSYDVKLVGRNGRTCVVQGVSVKEGAVFSIAEKDLAACNR